MNFLLVFFNTVNRYPALLYRNHNHGHTQSAIASPISWRLSVNNQPATTTSLTGSKHPARFLPRPRRTGNSNNSAAASNPSQAKLSQAEPTHPTPLHPCSRWRSWAATPTPRTTGRAPPRATEKPYLSAPSWSNNLQPGHPPPPLPPPLPLPDSLGHQPTQQRSLYTVSP